MATSIIERPAWADDSEKRINYGSSSYVKYRKIGNVVVMHVFYKVSDGTISSWSSKDVATLPSGYRPLVDMVAHASTDRASSIGSAIYAYPSGIVRVIARYNAISDTTDSVVATLTYPTL